MVLKPGKTGGLSAQYGHGIVVGGAPSIVTEAAPAHRL